MTTSYEIPLSPDPQRFRISLKGVYYWITLMWNGASNTWMIDIANAQQVKMISSIPLVANINLLEQYGYFDIGGELWAVTEGDLTAPPTKDNMGIKSHLYFIVR